MVLLGHQRALTPIMNIRRIGINGLIQTGLKLIGFGFQFLS
jgi:hypothetical protein